MVFSAYVIITTLKGLKMGIDGAVPLKYHHELSSLGSKVGFFMGAQPPNPRSSLRSKPRTYRQWLKYGRYGILGHGIYFAACASGCRDRVAQVTDTRTYIVE